MKTEKEILFEKLSELSKKNTHKKPLSIKQAEKRKYKVRYEKHGNQIKARLNLPLCFAGREVKVKIIK